MQGLQDDENDQTQELADQQKPPKSEQASESSEKIDPRIYELIQAEQELAKNSKRLKKLQEKLASKQQIILDSQQAKLLDLEPQSSVSSPPVISQATILKAMVGEEALEDSSECDKKVNTDKWNKPTKYWINLKGKFCCLNIDLICISNMTWFFD